MRSAYGPKVVRQLHDKTFYYYITGYGPLIPNVIRSKTADFVFFDIGANRQRVVYQQNDLGAREIGRKTLDVLFDAIVEKGNLL